MSDPASNRHVDGNPQRTSFITTATPVIDATRLQPHVTGEMRVELHDRVQALDRTELKRHNLGLTVALCATQAAGAALLFCGSVVLAESKAWAKTETSPWYQSHRSLNSLTFAALALASIPLLTWLQDVAVALRDYVFGNNATPQEKGSGEVRRLEILHATAFWLVIGDSLIVFMAILLTGGPGSSPFDPLLAAVPAVTIILRQPRKTVLGAITCQVLWGSLALIHRDGTRPPVLCGFTLHDVHGDENFHWALFIVIVGSLLLLVVETCAIHKIPVVGFPKAPRWSASCDRKFLGASNKQPGTGRSQELWPANIDSQVRSTAAKRSAAIKRGAVEWARCLDWLGLNPVHISRVHGIDETYSQAVILCLPYWACDNVEKYPWASGEVDWRRSAAALTERIAYLTFAAHWIDDLFDGADYQWGSGQARDNALETKGDLTALMSAAPAVERAVQRMLAIVNSDQREAAIRGIRRIVLGGCIQNARTVVERIALEKMYAELVREAVTPGSTLFRGISGLRPGALWATSKVVMELLHSCEPGYVAETAEAYNLLYAPILYYQDIAMEKAVEGFGEGVSEKLSEWLPGDEELLGMLSMYEEWRKENTERLNVRRARMRQLDLLRWQYRSQLPDVIHARYVRIIGSCS
ncbi:MAG: hypothetical protein HYR85_08330 [Planctomycetes bacterium]|nr:hypothetical protein [Planctomycetota bacterium]MBI3845299.1 hypothetical protein [Planctomycetota bacterium]